MLLLAIEYRQETVYELPRRNEVSFKAKAKRTTTKNKTNRKKQRKVELFAQRPQGNCVDKEGLFIENTRNARNNNNNNNNNNDFHTESTDWFFACTLKVI